LGHSSASPSATRRANTPRTSPAFHIQEEQGINQEEAADRCGLHRTYYSGIERGVRNVSLVNIEKVGKGLRTSLPNLFEKI
jgi:transcriptional regulator with XRE-family HTH domain